MSPKAVVQVRLLWICGLILDLRLDEFLNDWLALDPDSTVVTHDLVVSQDTAAELAAGIDVLQFFPVEEDDRQEHATHFGLAEALDPVTTVEITTTDGSGVPEWLVFDLETLTFTGDWPVDATDPLDLIVTLSVDQRFIAAGYWETHEGPDVVSHVINTTLSADDLDALATDGVMIGTDRAILDFKRSDLVVTATTDNGRALPDWLEYDADAGAFTLTGITPDVDAEPVTVRLTFTPDFPYNPNIPLRLPENFHLAADGSYTLAFTFDPAVGIDPAINAMLVPDAFFAASGLLALPTFDASNVVITMENGADLPDWLTFNTDTLAFEGTPPREYVGALPIKIAVPATDTQPAYAILHELPVDRGFLLEPLSDLGISFTSETISVVTPEDFDGAIAIEYNANDGKDGMSEEPAFLVANILSQPETPDVYADTFIGQEDEVLSFTLVDMLENDRDDDDDPFYAVSVIAPLTGTFTVNAAPLTIDGAALFAGASGGVYAADLPQWLSIDPATGLITGEQPLDAIGDLTVTVSYDGVTADVTVALDGNAGVSFDYLPEPGFSGDVTFDYVISDNKDGTGTGTVTLTIEPLNDIPVAETDFFEVIEDTPKTITVAELLENDTDEDGDTLTIIEVFDATNGTVTFDGAEVIFTPTPNYDGGAQFKYTVSDGQGGEATTTVGLDVISTNLAPVIGVDRRDGVEDTPITIAIADLLLNDSDPNGDDISFVSFTQNGSDGLAFENQFGEIQFNPSDDANGVITWTYTITDGRLETTGLIELDFAAVNDGPTAREDSGFVTAEDTTIAIAFADLTVNDTDVEGDAFSVINAFDGVNGDVTFDTEFAYFTPRADYFGNAGFTYTLQDVNGASSEGYVALSVTPEDDLPIAVTDSGYVLDEDTFIDIDPVDLVANDYDPDGGGVTFLRMKPAIGLTDNGDGTFRYTPDADDFGLVTLAYVIDGGNGVEVTGEVRLNVLPISDDPIANDDALNGTEDTVLTVLGRALTGNDDDADGQALTITGFANAVGVSVALNRFGEVVITPDADFNGNASFDYTVEDTTGIAATASVVVNFAPTNDAPEMGEIADLDGIEDSLFQATLDPSLFTDVDGDTLLVDVTLADGSALPAWLAFDPDTLVLSGQPPANFNGVLPLEVSVTDGEDFVSQLVDLTIAEVNDAPIAMNDTFNAGTDTTIALAIADVIGNDLDVDGDAISVTSVTGGAGFTAEIVGTDIVVTRDADLDGQITLDYTLTDGALTDTGTITIDLAAANVAPVVAEIAPLRSDEDAAINITLPEDVATDADGDALTLTVARDGGAPMPTWLAFDATTRTFTGTPPANFNGTVALQLTASDGRLSDTRAFELVIDPVNDAPTLTAPFSDRFASEDEAFNVALQQNLFTDVDGDALSVDVRHADGSALPDWISFDTDAFALVGQAPQDYAGTLQLRIFASDGAEEISDDFALVITAVNDAPVLVSPLLDQTTDIDGVPLSTGQAFVIATQTAAFRDVDGDALAFAAELADGTPLPTWLAFDGISFSGTAPKSAAGTIEIRLLASDGQAEVSDVFALIIEERNSAPVANPDAFAITVPNVAEIDQAALLANDTDFDPDDTLNIVAVAGSDNGTVSITDGIISYFADNQFEGEDTFNYTVSDGTDTATGTVTVTVTNPYDDVIVNEGGGSDVDFGGNGDDYIDGGRGSDAVFGGRGDDQLYGGRGRDVLSGGSGDDDIFGGNGRDVIFGGSGADNIDGGNGADTIFTGRGGGTVAGGAGRDTLFGGRDQDTFLFAEGDGRDTIYNFQTPSSGRRGFIPGDELRLNVDGIDNVDDLMAYATQTNSGVLFDFGDGDRIFLAGTQLAALDDDQFSFY